MLTKKKGNRKFEAYEFTNNKTKVDVYFDWGDYWNSETFVFNTTDLEYAIKQADRKSAGM